MAEKSDFGILGKALETTKIYGGSNTVRKFDAVVEADSLQTLGSYVRNPKNAIDTRGMNLDTKADDRLLKYNIVKITPRRNLDEVENPLEMYLIVDEHGHDIGTYEITEKGPTFKLSPKIQEHNRQIEEQFQGQAREVLEEKYSINTLEELVQKLSKGEDIALASNEQAKDDVSEDYKKRGIPVEVSKEQEPEEKEALKGIPADMRGEAMKFARERGLKVKDILVVSSAKELASQIDNRQNQISPTGGPVILIRANHGGVDSLGDDVYALQNGQAVQSERNDDTLEDLMKQHKDEGQVHSLRDNEGDRVKEELTKIIEEAQRAIEQEEEEIAQIQYQMENFEAETPEQQETIVAQMQTEIEGHEANIANIISSRDSQIQTLARERYPLAPFDEKGMSEVEQQVDSSAQTPENDGPEEDEGMYKNRWETANPFNGPSNN